MSKGASKRAQREVTPAEGDAAVGYGKPPKANRFVPGRSGNPNGRPKKPKRAEALAQFFGNDDFHRLVLEEAGRMVTVQEKGRSVEMSAMQAMLRTTTLAAIKGDRAAREFMGQSVREAKRDQAKKKEDIYDSWMRHRDTNLPLFLEAEKMGRPPPEIYPHPADLYFNHYTKEVRIEGPISAEEAALFQARLREAHFWRMRANEAGELYTNARSPAKKKQLLERWHKEQARYDEINDAMPLRYQMDLEYRSYAPGASEPKPNLAMIEFLSRRRSD